MRPVGDSSPRRVAPTGCTWGPLESLAQRGSARARGSRWVAWNVLWSARHPTGEGYARTPPSAARDRDNALAGHKRLWSNPTLGTCRRDAAGGRQRHRGCEPTLFTKYPPTAIRGRIFGPGGDFGARGTMHPMGELDGGPRNRPRVRKSGPGRASRFSLVNNGFSKSSFLWVV
jgi:hypothetical protein